MSGKGDENRVEDVFAYGAERGFGRVCLGAAFRIAP